MVCFCWRVRERFLRGKGNESVNENVATQLAVLRNVKMKLYECVIGIRNLEKKQKKEREEYYARVKNKTVREFFVMLVAKQQGTSNADYCFARFELKVDQVSDSPLSQ